jgi:C4-dicarboxylate-specific signal transduction histidine kinase
VSVAAAFGLAHAFLYFDLPQPFAALALCAIAITFWYGGNGAGVLAAVLAAIVRTFIFEPEVHLVSRLTYDLVFLVFAVLMTQATRARHELESRIAERTAALTRANEALRFEIAERTRAEEQLRQSEAYLAEAQRLTHTGSWAGNIATGERLHSSEEHTRLYGFDPDKGDPSFEDIYRRVHPDDRARLVEVLHDASRTRSDVAVDYRIVLPDGTTRYVLAVGHPVGMPSAHPGEFVGFLMDITERRQADEERERLRQVQADLTHISRVTTMGELTASLAHEVNQPIAAAVTDANTCLRWLQRDEPDVDEAREAAARVVKDATRAAEIISRIRLLFTKGTTQREEVDVNDVVREMVTLLRGETARHGIAVRTELVANAPRVTGDRVQLQQVIMNLIMNGIDSMKDAHGTRELVVRSRPTVEGVAIEVSDTGPGVPARHAEEIFNPFFTTKTQGTGMGLSISRSIVESHGGKLRVADNLPCGATFHVTLPAIEDRNESAGSGTDGLRRR